ncbi:hypothetical protein HanPSC8_Chr08g0314721 [Helianthus annuus]|nr:hypothetical protein HanPSC8_Chr08g0314721 [Helianthus annuus]
MKGDEVLASAGVGAGGDGEVGFAVEGGDKGGEAGRVGGDGLGGGLNRVNVVEGEAEEVVVAGVNGG